MTGLMTTLKGLPSTYNKDLQEDKAAIFEADDTTMQMLDVAIAMGEHIHFDAEQMERAVTDPAGFLMSTELADWLVQQGVPFREAHEAIGQLVRLAESREMSAQDRFAPLRFRVQPAGADLLAHDPYAETVTERHEPLGFRGRHACRQERRE